MLVVGCAPHSHKSGCWPKAVTHVGERQENLQWILTPCFPLGISSWYLSQEREIMLSSQWFTFIQALISTLQSTSSEHTHQGDVKTADLGTRNSLTRTPRPGAGLVLGCHWHKNHLRFVWPSHHGENWKLQVVIMKERCGVQSQPSQNLPCQL